MSKSRYILKCDDIVSGLDVRHPLTNRFDDTGTFMAKNDRESPLWIFPRQSVCIYQFSAFTLPRNLARRVVPVWQTPV